jgi:uncharacterized membrane protein YczE
MITVAPRIELHTLPINLRPVARVPQLFIGLVLYGVSMAMQVRSTLGLDPWDSLTDGLTHHFALSFGTITAIISLVVFVCWIPLRQRPGFGTIANFIIIPFAVDGALAIIPTPQLLAAKALLLAGAILTNAVASALYIGARLGPGPRDGLSVGLYARTGKSLRLIRTSIELSVLALGFLLGGTIGLGTLLYAVLIGPLTQALLPWVVYRRN